ncbi:hypothetical protein KKH36_02000 [Patescibacteria group bacterium]|nr:hypothetical protein [Patescibacteria group bacterium]
MTNKDIEVDAAKKLAGLQIDQLSKLRSNQITFKHLEWFNNLSKDERNYLLEKRFEKDLFIPNKAFQNRKGLWVSSDFKERILLVAEPIEKNKTISTSFIDLKKPMADTEVRANPPKNHVFRADEFCLYLIDKIRQQPYREEGEFLINGKANIHFVYGKNDRVFLVAVDWRVLDLCIPEWHVNTYPLIGFRWNLGSRVFYPNYDKD